MIQIKQTVVLKDLMEMLHLFFSPKPTSHIFSMEQDFIEISYDQPKDTITWF